MANDKRDEILEAARIWLNRNCPSRLIKEYDASRLADFAIAYAAATAEGIPQADGWVDVADRLPDAKEGWNHSEQVLVWYQPSLDAVGNYGIAYYHYDPPYRPCEWVDFAHLGRDPIAWQPLPTPYQRQSSEGDSK